MGEGHRAGWNNVPGRQQNLRGPNRALTAEEQMEIHRALREATPEQRRAKAAARLAIRYGVSIRTVWRYAEHEPRPDGTEYLAARLRLWATERSLDLTHDDITTLLWTLAHRLPRMTEAELVAAYGATA